MSLLYIGNPEGNLFSSGFFLFLKRLSLKLHICRKKLFFYPKCMKWGIGGVSNVFIFSVLLFCGKTIDLLESREWSVIGENPMNHSIIFV